MRKTTAGLFISLDGVTESPNEWQFDHFDEGMAAEMTAFERETDTILLGRVTYEEWAPYWPTSTDEPFATFINETPKHVVSTTLEKPLEWSNSMLVEGNLAEEISELKQKPGKNIGVAGSPTLLRSLLLNDLLDELTLMVHPVVVGSGKRLFDGGGDTKRLELADSKTTRTGVSILTYRPKK
ncbi:MAG: dihydrofolate reductase family protein [Rubrobacter sp.]|jgi:dihydrofolate reductase|nr:dihydrofolate reductase family protein [Rubrobacter sp.]